MDLYVVDGNNNNHVVTNCDAVNECHKTTEDWEGDNWFCVQFGFDLNENNKMFCSVKHAVEWFKNKF